MFKMNASVNILENGDLNLLSSVSPIYLDYQSTTPIDPRVFATVKRFMEEEFGNPHSQHHYGEVASVAVEKARGEISDLIEAFPNEIIFTSGATESNNLAILGLREMLKEGRNHLVTLSTEHKCVLAAMNEMKQLGFNVDVMPVNSDGSIDLDILDTLITDKTALVSILYVNNEIGTIHPISEISAICQKHGALFHTDAAQATGKIPIDVDRDGIDLLSISGHKMYGPKGIGALFIRQGIKNKIKPIIFGGGQEGGVRSGTLPAPLCIGLGAACKLLQQEMSEDQKVIEQQKDIFMSIILEKVPFARLNGSLKNRIYNNLNICFAGVSSQDLLACIHDRVSASTGSACTSGFIEPSHVLTAIGLPSNEIESSLRFGFGKGVDSEQIKLAANTIASEANRLIN